MVVYVFVLYSSVQPLTCLGSQKSIRKIPKKNKIVLLVFIWLGDTIRFVNRCHLHILLKISTRQNIRSVRFLCASLGFFSVNFSGTIQNCISLKMHQSASKRENNFLSARNLRFLQYRRDVAWHSRCYLQ